MHKNSIIRKVSLGGMLVALGFCISYVERFFPIELIVPIPGIKLGLANIITMFCACRFKKVETLLILLSRCILSAFMFGTVSSLMFSLAGGILAYIMIITLFSYEGRIFSVIGISVAGAACHNIGQVLFATFYLQTASVFSYLPFLLVSSIFTGAFTGVVCMLVMKRLPTKYKF